MAPFTKRIKELPIKLRRFGKRLRNRSPPLKDAVVPRPSLSAEARISPVSETQNKETRPVSDDQAGSHLKLGDNENEQSGRSSSTTANATLAPVTTRQNMEARQANATKRNDADLYHGNKGEGARSHDIQPQNTGLDLWDRSYQMLKESEEDSKMIQEFEIIVARELGAADGKDTLDPQSVARPEMQQRVQRHLEKTAKSAREQMKQAIDIGQERTAKVDEVMATLGSGLKTVLHFKDLIDTAIKASESAAVVWTAVSLGLNMFLVPLEAPEKKCAGIVYVMERLRWYDSLSRVVLKTDAGASIGSHLRDSMEERILELYKIIIRFLIPSVLSYFRSQLTQVVRDFIGVDDWNSSLQDVKDKEEALRKDIQQFNLSESLNLSREGRQNFQQFFEHWLAEAREKRAHLVEKRRATQSRLTGKFKTTDYRNQMELNPKPVPRTCEWFRSHPKFRDWMNGATNSNVLLVSAGPGCGKSTLARHLIETVLPEEMRDSGRSLDTVILYFFFKDTHEQKRLDNCLCAMLHQLFCEDGALANDLKQEIYRGGDNITSDKSSLWQVFAKACDVVATKRKYSLYCVFDAMDECEAADRQVLVRNLESLVFHGDHSQPGKHVRFLLTTRGQPEILRQFSSLQSKRVHLSGDGKEEIDQIQREINLVLDYKLEQLSAEKQFSEESGCKRRVFRALQDQSSEQRTYLWLKLVFEVLFETYGLTDDEWEKLARDLPRTVEDAYESLLAKVGDTVKIQVLLQILVAARRPLSLRELNIALHIRDKVGKPDEGELGLASDEEFRKWLVQNCGFFVMVYDDRVFFLHQTAKEFLVCGLGKIQNGWKHSIKEGDANKVLGESCVAYLSLGQFKRQEFQDSAARIKADRRFWKTDADPGPRILNLDKYSSTWKISAEFAKHKFLNYAISSWDLHFRQCSQYCTSIDIESIPHYPRIFSLESPQESAVAPALAVLALLRDELGTRFVLDSLHRRNIGLSDSLLDNFDPIDFAAALFEPNLFEHFLKMKVHQEPSLLFKTSSATGLTTFHLVAALGHVKGLELILDMSTDKKGIVPVQDHRRHTLPRTPSSLDPGMSMLSPRYIDIKTDRDETALWLAAERCNLPAVRMLLDQGASIGVTESHPELLDKIIRRYNYLREPQCLDILELLAQHGLNMHMPVRGMFLLQIAAESTPMYVCHPVDYELEELVTKKAESMPGFWNYKGINHQNLALLEMDLESDSTFLRAYEQSLIKFLVDRNVPTLHRIGDSRPDNSQTALEIRCQRPQYHGTPWEVAFLLHAGSAPSTRIKLETRPTASEIMWEWSQPALSASIENVEAFALLLNYGCIPDGIDKLEATLMLEGHLRMAAGSKSGGGVVELLLQLGLQMDSTDAAGKTLLHHACEAASDETVNALLRYDTKNIIQSTPVDGQPDPHKTLNRLRRYVLQNRSPVAPSTGCVTGWFSHGADPNVKDNLGRTPLHSVFNNIDTRRGIPTVVHLLLLYGANPHLCDNEGLTPLRFGIDAMVQLQSKYRYEETIDIDLQPLVNAGADIDTRDKKGLTALHQVCNEGDHWLVDFLLDYGACKDAQEMTDPGPGRTPLHFACGSLAKECVSILLQRGVNVYARDAHNRSALHYLTLGDLRKADWEEDEENLDHDEQDECFDDIGPDEAVFCHIARRLLDAGLWRCVGDVDNDNKMAAEYAQDRGLRALARLLDPCSKPYWRRRIPFACARRHSVPSFEGIPKKVDAPRHLGVSILFNRSGRETGY